MVAIVIDAYLNFDDAGGTGGRSDSDYVCDKLQFRVPNCNDSVIIAS